eukprot:1945896-Pyramimonas_sp.AAC.1
MEGVGEAEDGDRRPPLERPLRTLEGDASPHGGRLLRDRPRGRGRGVVRRFGPEGCLLLHRAAHPAALLLRPAEDAREKAGPSKGRARPGRGR